MNIVFMGTPAYATVILKALLEDKCFNVTLLVTQEDKPVGRKQVLTPPDTKAFIVANNYAMEIYQPKTLRTDEASIKIASYKPDFIVVAAYGQILPKSILSIAPCLNLHASLLPQYRGASPIQSTILKDDMYAGVSAMLMEEGLDTGAVLGLSYVDAKRHNALELFNILANVAATLIVKTLKNFDNLLPLKQVDAESSHCKKIKKEDGEVDFKRDSAHDIVIKARAFMPWPGIFLATGMKLHSVKLSIIKSNQLPGTIVDISNQAITIVCKEGCLDIETLQPMSKNIMKVQDYILGKRLLIGDTLA
ncbi:MAG: methionyl-tRNA formyltransferase [Sulfurospirillaceae bacterium]|nr:methionyl-tRNA formyltransferase [Sulfurospirillaceae bacterium]